MLPFDLLNQRQNEAIPLVRERRDFNASLASVLYAVLRQKFRTQ